MTLEEALKTKYVGSDDNGKMLLAYSSEQLHVIKEALKRNEPMKPIAYDIKGNIACPNCERILVENDRLNSSYCKRCGQALKWNDDEE